MLTRSIFAGVFMLAVTGCSGEALEPVASTEAPIIDGSFATQWQWQRAVTFGNCTGTVIGKRHVLTAAHCKPKVGNFVRFYTEAFESNASTATKIVDVDYRPGVYPYSDDLTDVNDDFADISVVTLEKDIPGSSRIAELAYTYPGAGVIGTQVGRGAHEGNENLAGQLRYRLTHTRSSSVSDGSFLTEDQGTNPGDSGGAFYVSGVLQGALYGWVYDWGYRNKYTHVGWHLPWILSKMGYSAATNFTLHQGKMTGGDAIETFATADIRVCAKACEQHSSCKSFIHQNMGIMPLCTLREGTTLVSGYPDFVTTGVKK